MKIVIDMPEKRYEHIMRMQFYIPGLRSGKSLVEEMLTTIRNGTPLPKGHGDLVDFDRLCEEYWDGNYIEIHKDDLSNIKPIIKADTESEAQDADSY